MRDGQYIERFSVFTSSVSYLVNVSNYIQGKVFDLAFSKNICHSKPKLEVYRDGLYPTVTSYVLYDDDDI